MSGPQPPMPSGAGRERRGLRVPGLHPGVESRFYPWPDAAAGPNRHDRGMSEPQVVTVRGLRKSYGAAVVVDGLDLDVPAGAVPVDGDAGALPATAGRAVYRIVQEALTNAVKHAPGSPTAVRLAVGAGEVTL